MKLIELGEQDITVRYIKRLWILSPRGMAYHLTAEARCKGYISSFVPDSFTQQEEQEATITIERTDQ